MDLAKWVAESKPSDWIQAASAVGALIVAYGALSVAKQNMNATVFTKVEIKDFKLSNGEPEFTLYNSGPGVAYNVRLKAGIISNSKWDPIYPGMLWFDEKSEKAKGPTFIQPNSFITLRLDESSVKLNLNHPFIISYSLASGKKVKIFMKYESNQRSRGEIVHLTKVQILKYLIRATWLYIRHPFMSLKYWTRERKARNNQESNNKTEM